MVAYLALQYAQAALENIHDGVVDALPVVDDLVVVDACDQEDGTVVLARLGYPVCLCFLGVPPALLGCVLFRLGDLLQELDVAGREQVPPTVDVDYDLARLHAFALYELVELALLLFHGAH